MKIRYIWGYLPKVNQITNYFQIMYFKLACCLHKLVRACHVAVDASVFQLARTMCSMKSSWWYWSSQLDNYWIIFFSFNLFSDCSIFSELLSKVANPYGPNPPRFLLTKGCGSENACSAPPGTRHCTRAVEASPEHGPSWGNHSWDKGWRWGSWRRRRWSFRAPLLLLLECPLLCPKHLAHQHWHLPCSR